MSEWPRFFKTPPIIYVGGKRPWKLTDECVYLSDVTGIQKSPYEGVIRVPAGYHTDLASVPRVPGIYWRVGNKAVLAAIVHDWLYEYGEYITRKDADDAFLEAMIDTEDPPWPTTRWIMYTAVRLFANGAWKRYRKHVR